MYFEEEEEEEEERPPMTPPDAASAACGMNAAATTAASSRARTSGALRGPGVAIGGGGEGFDFGETIGGLIVSPLLGRVGTKYSAIARGISPELDL